MWNCNEKSKAQTNGTIEKLFLRTNDRDIHTLNKSKEDVLNPKTLWRESLSENKKFDKIAIFSYSGLHLLNLFLRKFNLLDFSKIIAELNEKDLSAIIILPRIKEDLEKISRIIASVLSNDDFKDLVFVILQEKDSDTERILTIIKFTLSINRFNFLPVKNRRVLLYEELELIYEKYEFFKEVLTSEDFIKKYLILYIQPIHNKSGIFAYEVLSRIKGPDGVTIYNPGNFFWIFDYDKILFKKFERSVVKKFLILAEDLNSHFSKLNHLEFHINITPTSLLENLDLILKLSSRLRSKLCVELIEVDYQVSNFRFFSKDDINQALSYLRKRDIKIIIDDFGTGRNNVELLNEIKVDGIKIPLELIKCKNDNKETNEIAKEDIIKYAFSEFCMKISFHMRLYFEKIESEKDLNWIKNCFCSYSSRSLGCFYQGFILGKPFPLEEIFKT